MRLKSNLERKIGDAMNKEAKHAERLVSRLFPPSCLAMPQMCHHSCHRCEIIRVGVELGRNCRAPCSDYKNPPWRGVYTPGCRCEGGMFALTSLAFRYVFSGLWLCGGTVVSLSLYSSPAAGGAGGGGGGGGICCLA
jgi:hypothetical protein